VQNDTIIDRVFPKDGEVDFNVNRKAKRISATSESLSNNSTLYVNIRHMSSYGIFKTFFSFLQISAL